MIEPTFYGSATISEKGQIVIPAKARNALDLKTGDELLVMSVPMGKGVVMVKPDILEEMTSAMSKNFEDYKKIKR